MTGIIYKATNLVNGKVYIGQTTRTLEQRRKEHEKSTKTQYLFQRALKKYGKESFFWEVIDTANDYDELNIKEMNWISHFQSYKTNGYNMTLGGDGVVTFRLILMFDKKDILIGQYRMSELVNMGFDASRVYRVCKSEALSTRGMQFLYADEYPTFEKQNRELAKRRKRLNDWKKNREREVSQYTMDGALIRRYPSVIKAGSDNDVSRKAVLDCIRGNQSNLQGSIFLYSDSIKSPEELKSEIVRRNKMKRKIRRAGIYQFDKQGHYLNHFSSIKETSTETTIPAKSIQKSCSKEYLSTNGYVFLYKDDYSSIYEARIEVFNRMKITPTIQEAS